MYLYRRQKQEFSERQLFSQACGHDSDTVVKTCYSLQWGHQEQL